MILTDKHRHSNKYPRELDKHLCDRKLAAGTTFSTRILGSLKGSHVDARSGQTLLKL